MTVFATGPGPDPIPVHIVAEDRLTAWLDHAPDATARFVEALGFRARLGELALLPDPSGALAGVLAGWGTAAARARDRFHLAGIVPRLPAGRYRIAGGLEPEVLAVEALGWLMALYRFDRYRSQGNGQAELVAPDGIDAARIETIAAGDRLARDLINTPANDLGPDGLEAAVRSLAETHGAAIAVTAGDALIGAALPLIHAVGRAATAAPRLIDLRWGRPDAPKITLIGKGVCFDTGGLNLKPGSAMGLMKKDMGGAATAIALAGMLMASGTDIRLRLLVPAVENAVAGNALRPGDILTSRKGLSIEVNNTDAEGRLILADALALAAEDAPDLTVSLATLTGAARVALGPDLPACFTDDEDIAAGLAAASRAVADPLWRMPFWTPYETLIEPGIADLDNAPSGGMAGAITAALFLRRFAPDTGAYVHLDLYGWTQNPRNARPKGAAFQAGRALFAYLTQRYGPCAPIRG